MSWKDVSAECEVQFDNQIYHKTVQPGTIRWQRVTEEAGGHPYRLTKISGPLSPHVAFIVEKEE